MVCLSSSVNERSWFTKIEVNNMPLKFTALFAPGRSINIRVTDMYRISEICTLWGFCYSTLRTIPEERKSHLHRDGRLTSRTCVFGYL